MPREIDLVIIGGGPAGLTAGLYAARARLDAVLIERTGPGGQVLLTDVVENWPGIPEGISGYDLSDRLAEHARKFGLKVESGEVRRLHPSPGAHRLEMGDGQDIVAKAVIIASGARPNRLGIPGEEELIGKGVSFCATCDGPFFRNEVVAVVGGGDTAVSEALYLSRLASRVYLIHRREALRATAVLQERLLANETVTVLWGTEAVAVEGAGKVEAVRIHGVKDREERSLLVSGLFVFIGVLPNVSFLAPGDLKQDPCGFIVTDQEMATSVPGIFACGDVRDKSFRQITTASGDGATATHSAQEYLSKLA
jgi:thioredoxin reductase (NADPH)